MNPDKAKEKLYEKSAVVRRVFSTPDGMALLDLLRREFFSRLEAKEEHNVVFKAGQADVVAYLMQLNSLQKEE
jgi:hypothetical protein